MKYSMYTLLIFIFMVFSNQQIYSQPQYLGQYGVFESHTDIGNPGIPGSVQYNEGDQSYLITGSGENMWFDTDEFYFVWKRLSGDFLVRADMEFVGEGNHAHRKMGIIIRNNLTPESEHVNAVIHGDGLTSLQYRAAIGNETEEKSFEANGPKTLQLERRGDKYIMSIAFPGEPFQEIEMDGPELKDQVYVGLFVCSHIHDYAETAVFSNVRVVKPAPDTLVPYRDYLGSNLEIMDVATGKRKVIFQSPISIQAPNWTPDNKRLIINSEGLLLNYHLESGKISRLNTGFATNNNNDHVLSFDGKQLGISHHTEEDDGQSVIYILPSEGGTPKRITPKAPSYLHGWSPDAKYLTFTGGRDGNYDIYKIGIEDQKEIRLTTAEGLDDGSEYSPDGKYIYFNSNRTGTMQIWRMKPDGSEQEQLTFDKYNDWFPHISPDGKQMIFISYGTDVESGDHPFYKHVYLRMMPVDGGEPRVIAYLYGGQGTINVPSWSPDGTKVSFVSNTGK